MMEDEAGPVPQACLGLSAAVFPARNQRSRVAHKKAFQGGDRSLVDPVLGIDLDSGTMWNNQITTTESKSPLTA
jgi:hypothetical protein